MLTVSRQTINKMNIGDCYYATDNYNERYKTGKSVIIKKIIMCKDAINSDIYYQEFDSGYFYYWGVIEFHKNYIFSEELTNEQLIKNIIE